MTRVDVEAGICGFSSSVSAARIDGISVRIVLKSECELVRKLGEALERVDVRQVFHRPFNENIVYDAAGKANLHASCPVPCSILKAVEVELGLALRKDAMIRFNPTEDPLGGSLG